MRDVYLQEAVAVGLETELSRLGEKECYYNALPASLITKRDRMVKLLSDVGMVPTVPDGSYFIVADFSNIGRSYFVFTLAPRVKCEGSEGKNSGFLWICLSVRACN